MVGDLNVRCITGAFGETVLDLSKYSYNKACPIYQDSETEKSTPADIEINRQKGSLLSSAVSNG